jgi:hypothetical protein
MLANAATPATIHCSRLAGWRNSIAISQRVASETTVVLDEINRPLPRADR